MTVPATLRTASLIVSALLMAAISGFFYAYAVSVMRGLDVLEPDVAIRAMQGINATVRNMLFAPAFFGTLAMTLITALLFVLHRRDMTAGLVAAAALLYAAGGFGLTLFWNVPMNTALATQAIPADPVAALGIWRDYFGPWMDGNTARTVISFMALLFLLLALRRDGRAA
jgi:uncharacterized membrane protein